MGAPKVTVEVAFDADPTAAYSDVVLGDVPYAYYRLDQTSGNFIDSSGNNFTATAVATINYTQTGALTGDTDKAAQFTTGYVTSTVAATTGNLATGFTLEAWVKRVGNPVSNGIIYGAASTLQMFVTTTGTVTVGYYDSGAVAHTATSTGTVTDGNWHHVVGGWDGSSVYVFIDGLQSGTATLTTTAPLGNTNGLAIGAFGDGTAKLGTVSLDEVAFYRGNPLTATDIANHYRAAPVNVTPTWTDLSARVMELHTRRGRQNILEKVEAGTCTVVLDNYDRALDPTNTSSVYSPNVLPMRKMRLRVGENGVANPRAANTTSGWTGTYVAGTGITLTRLTNDGVSSTTSMQVTGTPSSGAYVMIYPPGTPLSNLKPVSVGDVVNLSAWVKPISGVSSIQMLARNMTAGLALVSETAVATVNGPTAGTWIRISSSYTVPASTGNVGVEIEFIGTNGVAITGNMTDVQIVAGDQIQPYVDSPMYVFSGYVERWPTEWQAKWQQVTITATDGFDALAPATIDGTFAQALSGTQVGLALTAAAWPRSQRTIAAGQFTMGAKTFLVSDEQSALDFIETLADSEVGMFFVGTNGNATFQDKQTRLSAPYTTSQGTFGDAGDGTEIDYEDLTPTYDRDRIVNDWRVTGVSGVLKEAYDDTSIRRYFRRSQSRSTNLANDADALTQAQYLLTLTKDAKLYFDTIVLKPLESRTLWQQVLNRELSDRITVIRRPPGGGTSITQDCFIEAINIDAVNVGDWTITYRLSPAS
jgi:hypothetical protein